MAEDGDRWTHCRLAIAAVAVCLVTVMVATVAIDDRLAYNTKVNVIVGSKNLLLNMLHRQENVTLAQQGKGPPEPKSAAQPGEHAAAPIYMCHHYFGARLGNKMWMLAAGLQLAARNTRPLYISAEFEADLKAVFKMENNETYFIGTPPTGTKVLDFEKDEKRARICDGLWIDELYRLPAEPVSILGYFQCKRFLIGIESELSRLFTVRDVYRAKARLIFDQISAKLNLTNPLFVGVHVRRSDLLKEPEKSMYRVPDASYFYKAMTHFRQKYGSRVHFVVASDSGHWCRETFANMTDVSIPDQGREVDMALLVALSRRIIISLGTFSFWAAWPGGGQADVIYFNRPFFNEARTRIVMDKIYLDQWTPMGN